MSAPAEPAVEPVEGAPPPQDDGWRTDKRGRAYVPKPGGGAVFRRDEAETVADALARDAAGPPPAGDKRPRRKAKPKRGPLPPAPEGIDLKALEKEIADTLAAPAYGCAMLGDQWAADHFTTQAPLLARNLVLAAEHNPWLRRKLEGMATGQDATMKVLAMFGLAGALVGYAFPPVVYFLNLPVPDKARQMFAIPPRRDEPQPQPDAEGPAPAAPAAEPIAA